MGGREQKWKESECVKKERDKREGFKRKRVKRVMCIFIYLFMV